MNKAPRISSVDDACEFLITWFGWGRDLGGSAIALPFEVPRAIETVNRRLGRLWLEKTSHPIFDSQDRLISPHKYEAGLDGAVPFASENQYVWECAFKAETGAQLWVTGKWPDDENGTWESWRAAPDMDVDIAIIFVLLANTMWSSDKSSMDEEDEKPVDANQLLWNFAPFSGFRGFWANDDATLMRMQGTGWGLTLRR